MVVVQSYISKHVTVQCDFNYLNWIFNKKYNEILGCTVFIVHLFVTFAEKHEISNWSGKSGY